jgi:hypothetical protein
MARAATAAGRWPLPTISAVASSQWCATVRIVHPRDAGAKRADVRARSVEMHTICSRVLLFPEFMADKGWQLDHGIMGLRKQSGNEGPLPAPA